MQLRQDDAWQSRHIRHDPRNSQCRHRYTIRRQPVSRKALAAGIVHRPAASALRLTNSRTLLAIAESRGFGGRWVATLARPA